MSLTIKLTSVIVNDQEKALQFYTQVLGFQLHKDIPMGDGRWLTVKAPGGPSEIELLLEPAHFPAAQTYQQALFTARIPFTAFMVEDIYAEYDRMKKLGVIFAKEPTEAGAVIITELEDTVGNLIMIYQEQ
ncbi:catechol 2,3-dioxygenase-like lactoylglutathione lyase family enzyme [Chitinophaga skermanii]|uniref:Catechol 2,3-dioxygenase-like lactoylglutathione lyase family enzyme n=1 Tax=Chitinophaga skermanii TaxID=331697 RepID=A0A327QP88_9BACT|nr:VOC family protein [Chitinophaga skermanii]RAJ05163.1 catechol 2,3-dioxygenase-like lactoylglutathione lyase family enzyme [Chitinophaga skermanii]